LKKVKIFLWGILVYFFLVKTPPPAGINSSKEFQNFSATKVPD
jgi:hypothetical protein